MRRTNSKEAMEAIKNAIIESYNNCEEYYTYYGAEAKTEYNDICKDIMNAFFNEKCKYDRWNIRNKLITSVSACGEFH